MFEFPQGAKVLEVGCAEADWSGPMKQLRPDLHITSMDVRKCKRPGSDVLLVGSVLERTRFLPRTFDCIVAVSTIEHIGLGAYGDPVHPDGDTVAMRNCLEWTALGGWMYFDVPYGPYAVNGNFRRYDESHVQARLLNGWTEQARMVIEADHPDAPYLALTVTPA